MGKNYLGINKKLGLSRMKQGLKLLVKEDLLLQSRTRLWFNWSVNTSLGNI